MAYTVKSVAKMSGVSVRTLHFYDEVGLLKPAYLGANGYRFYEEAQLLILQQIRAGRTSTKSRHSNRTGRFCARTSLIRGN